MEKVGSVVVATLTLTIINFATFAKGRTRRRRNQTERKEAKAMREQMSLQSLLSV